MKYNLYVVRQIRKIQNKIGKKETLEKLNIGRTVIWRWESNEYRPSLDHLSNICILSAQIFCKKNTNRSEEIKKMYKELFMQGLYCLMVDYYEKNNNILSTSL